MFITESTSGKPIKSLWGCLVASLGALFVMESNAELIGYVNKKSLISSFIEVEIDLIDNDLHGLGIEQKGEKSKVAIRVSSITSFRENINKIGEVQGCVIYTSDGEQYWCYSTYPELKRLICNE